MSLRGRKDLIPIACVTVEDWNTIHEYCRRQDVATGGDYDAPAGGAVNVYMADNWVDPEAGLHGTFYPEQSRRFGWIDIFWQTGTYRDEYGRLPWEIENASFSLSGNWSAAAAREHFSELYEKATGKTYATSLKDLIDRAT